MAVIVVDPNIVQTIPAKTLVELRIQKGNLKVCAYARVSTDEEEQMTSYHSQITHYTDKIKNTKGWNFVEVFADEGITGTSTKNRVEFNKMIALCKKRKIDLILTKSISRFARNSLDSIQYARMLKRLGIGIIFEKENIDTRELTNEMIFVVLSAFAQAESESMSANISIGKRNGYKQGRFTFPDRMFGYEVIKKINIVGGKEEIVDRTITVVEDEAAVVRMIYRHYLGGATLRDIRTKLLEMGISSQIKKGWSTEQIDRILCNEKYKGYIILQKTFVDDLFTKEIKVNNGELPKYIIPNSHTPIVSEQIFDAVQAEHNRRNKSKTDLTELSKTGQSKYSGKYALTGKIYCGQCGTEYQRVVWRKKRNGIETVKEVWKCKKRQQKITYCKDSHIISEKTLHEIIHNAICTSLSSIDSLNTAIEDNIKSVLSSDHELPKTTEQIADKRSQMDILVKAVYGISQEEKDRIFEQIQQIMTEVKELEAKEVSLKHRQSDRLIDTAAMQRVTAICGSTAALPESYDDSLTRALVKSVTIQSDRTVDISFIDGTEIKGIKQG